MIRSIRGLRPESRLFLVVHADGVQKYMCQTDGTWLFTDPEATLSKTAGVAKPIGTHFLNFATGRPVQLKDGSSVEAVRRVTVSAGAETIPWLLLHRVVTTAGSDGDSLAATTWVQRLNTSGGVAPAGVCTPGNLSAVSYSAADFFRRAAGGRVRRVIGDEAGAVEASPSFVSVSCSYAISGDAEPPATAC